MEGTGSGMPGRPWRGSAAEPGRRRSPWAVLTLIVLAAIALGAPATASHRAQAATTPPRQLPILIGSNVTGFSSGSAGTAEGDARLAVAGVRLIRFDMLWSQVERQRGVFDFSALDARVSAAQAAGLEVLAILDYGNPLYSSRGAVASITPLAGGVPPFGVGQADYYPPDDPADFGRYARALAAHFRGRVLAYEIWNEENEGWRFWPPHEDASAYAALLRAAHTAVKAADPGATVLFGGVFFPALPPGLPGTAGDTFLDQGYAADPQLGSSFDAVAYHPYPYPFTSPEYDAPLRGSVPHAGDAMAAVLARHGNAGRPLWITELGWPTQSGYGVSPQKQAEYLVRGAALSAAAGLRAFTWYTYGDTADPTGYNQEAAFGLLDAQGRPKPAYTALDTFTRTLDGTVAAAARTDVSGADHAVAFSASSRRVTVLWNSPEGAASDQGTEPAAHKDTVAAVPIATGSVVRALSMAGDALTVTTEGGAARVAAATAPVYLVESAASISPSGRMVAASTTPTALPGTGASPGVSATPAALLAVAASLGGCNRRRARTRRR